MFTRVSATKIKSKNTRFWATMHVHVKILYQNEAATRLPDIFNERRRLCAFWAYSIKTRQLNDFLGVY